MQLDSSNTMRYCRHILLPEVQEEGQETLMNSHALIVGAGGLGCAVLQYLVAAGTGKITVFDHDTVDITNLQRQILYPELSVGYSKVETAKQQLAKLNSQVEINTFNKQFDHSDKSTLNSVNVASKVLVTVPDFGDGIKPFGPKTLPNFANFGIIFGVVINKSNSILP